MEVNGSHDSLQHNARLLTTLLEVSNLVSSAMEIKPLLEAILDKLGSIIEYKNAKIFITAGTQVRVIAHRSVLMPEQEEAYPFPLGLDHVFSKKPVVIRDLYSDDPLAVLFRRNMGKYMENVFMDARCWMSLPMVAKNRVIGVLTMDHGTAGYYNEKHIELGAAFANQAAVEYENAKLYNETVKKADEIKTMFNIQQAITSRLELDVVLKLIADEAWRLTNSHSTAVFLAEGEQLVLSVFSGERYGHGMCEGLHLPVQESAIGESLRQNKSIILKYDMLKRSADRELASLTGAHECICVPLLAGSRAVGVIAAFSRHSDEFDAEDERIFNMFAPCAVIGIENARLYQEERRRHQEDEQRRHVAESLRDILAVLNSNRSLEEIMDFIVKEAARLMHTDSAALFRLENSKLRLDAVCGIPHIASSVHNIGMESDFLVRTFAGRKPVLMRDWAEVDRMLSGVPGMEEHRKWLGAVCSGMLAVPLICKNEVYGGIVLYIKKDRKNTHQISEDDIDLAMTFADQAALAIDNTRLRKQAEEMAVAAERNRLARDLHDAVTQTLFSASLIAEVLPKIMERNRDEGLKRLEEIRQLARGALAEMRTLLFELRPATLMEAPLEELLRQLSEAITGRARVPVRLNMQSNAKLPTDVKIAFYRIAQEALNNIAKHAGATKADVELWSGTDEREGILTAGIRITDDGRGFDPAGVSGEHLGIGIMRERAEATGAKLRVDSGIGRGTTIQLEWSGKQTESSAKK